MGGYFEGARLLLLTTTGTPHATPVGYLPDGGDRVLVIASAGGSARHPDWFRNLVAHPQVSVESGTFTYEARAADAHAAIDGRGVVVKTSRVIPVVALHSVAQGGPGNINATSFAEAVGGRWPPAPPPSAPSSASTA
jgi:deazaflavin-dependent oxidoreductase (nitroreductase family)